MNRLKASTIVALSFVLCAAAPSSKFAKPKPVKTESAPAALPAPPSRAGFTLSVPKDTHRPSFVLGLYAAYRAEVAWQTACRETILDDGIRRYGSWRDVPLVTTVCRCADAKDEAKGGCAIVTWAELPEPIVPTDPVPVAGK